MKMERGVGGKSNNLPQKGCEGKENTRIAKCVDKNGTQSKENGNGRRVAIICKGRDTQKLMEIGIRVVWSSGRVYGQKGNRQKRVFATSRAPPVPYSAGVFHKLPINQDDDRRGNRDRVKKNVARG